MSLLTELDAFYIEHRQYGALEAGVDGPSGSAASAVRGLARRADEGNAVDSNG